MTIRSTALALIAALALAAAGCGQDEEGKPIPRAVAAELEKQLASIQDRFEFGDGACADITNENEPAVSRLLEQIPDDVDPDVRESARNSFDRLFELTASQCDETKGQDTTTTETETTPPETTPPETQETQTQETQTQETQTEPQTPDEDLPPGQQKKQERQNGSGGGPAAPEEDD